MNKNFKAGNQGGFTLIELIVVIVILGILAATALPKFANLGADARAASIKGASGAVASASALIHAQVLVRNTADGDTTIEGQTVTVKNGYPSAADKTKAENFAAAAGLSSTDYKFDTTTADKLIISPLGVASGNIATCSVTYNSAASTTAAPVITTVASKCD